MTSTLDSTEFCSFFKFVTLSTDRFLLWVNNAQWQQLVHLWSIQRLARLIWLLIAFVRTRTILISKKIYACVGFRVYSRRSRAGGGGSQETAVMVSSWRRSCRRLRSHAQVPTTQLENMSIDLKFAELTADVFKIFFIKYRAHG